MSFDESSTKVWKLLYRNFAYSQNILLTYRKQLLYKFSSVKQWNMYALKSSLNNFNAEFFNLFLVCVTLQAFNKNRRHPWLVKNDNFAAPYEVKHQWKDSYSKFGSTPDTSFCGTLVCRGTPVWNHCFNAKRLLVTWWWNQHIVFMKSQFENFKEQIFLKKVHLCLSGLNHQPIFFCKME